MVKQWQEDYKPTTSIPTCLSEQQPCASGGSGTDDDSTRGKTLPKSVYTTGGMVTIATTKFHADKDRKDDDADSFDLSLESTQSHLENNVTISTTHKRRFRKTDEQPDQEQRDVNFSPATIEAYRTNLLTTAVKDLGMNPEEGMEVRELN